MYEHRVVEWRECRNYLRALIEERGPDEIKALAMAEFAVSEKLQYWEKVCQPDLLAS